jgi:hypothetical protein
MRLVLRDKIVGALKAENHFKDNNDLNDNRNDSIIITTVMLRDLFILLALGYILSSISYLLELLKNNNIYTIFKARIARFTLRSIDFSAINVKL